jgi:hypothetical protein
MSFKDDFMIIPVSKDPSLITSLTSFIEDDPQAILTTNGVRLTQEALSNRQVAFNQSVDGRPNLVLSDGNLQALLVGDEVASLADTEIPKTQWDIYITKFRKEVLDKLHQLSEGRPIALNTYFNSQSSALLKKMGFLVLGPDSELVREYSSKINAYDLAKKIDIPVLDGSITNSLEEAVELFANKKDWEKGAFVTSERGSGGNSAKHIESLEELKEFRFAPPLLLTKWVTKESSPNSQVLVGRDESLYLGATDQIIVNGVEYFGNIFPSHLEQTTQDKIRRYSLKLANEMRKSGYRGFTGFDWIVTPENDIYFGEINPRKNRSSSMLVSALEQNKPRDIYSITELEALATLNEGWDNVREWQPKEGINWGMRLFKTWGHARVKRDILPEYEDSTIMQEEDKASSVLNFPQAGTYLEKFPGKHDLARIIAVGNSRREVELQIDQRRKEVINSYTKL